jgi:hypothetical protein
VSAKKPIDELSKFSIHKRSGNARVKLDGEEFWLGPADQPQVREKYDQLIGEWLRNGRKLPQPKPEQHLLSVSELIVAFMEHAAMKYARNGKPTPEYENLKPPLRVVRRLYGSTPASQFGPKALKAVREFLLYQHQIPQEPEEGKAKRTSPHDPAKQLSPRYLNKSINRIRRMFRWAVEEEMIPASVTQGLNAVAGLRRGNGGVEHPKITVVPDAFIEATLSAMSKTCKPSARSTRVLFSR